MRKILTLLAIAFSGDAWALDCPEGYVCLTDSDYAVVHQKLTELAEIESTHPEIAFERPVVLLTDGLGRVFSDSTGTQLIPGELVWGPVSADIEFGVSVDVRKKEEDDLGFRLRPKFSVSWLVLNTPLEILDVDSHAQLIGFGLSLDFLHYRKFNLNAYIGSGTFGAGLGFDVFENSGVLLDARWSWPFSGTNPTPTFTPALGWYFAF